MAAIPKTCAVLLVTAALAGAANRAPAQQGPPADAAPRLVVVEEFTRFT